MDFIRPFVVPQAEKHGMAQSAIAGPFGEADLANQYRQQPRAAAHLGAAQAVLTPGGKVDKRAYCRRDFLKPLVKGVQRLRVEARADF